jgi:hypothetical protein
MTIREILDVTEAKALTQNVDLDAEASSAFSAV